MYVHICELFCPISLMSPEPTQMLPRRPPSFSFCCPTDKEEGRRENTPSFSHTTTIIKIFVALLKTMLPFVSTGSLLLPLDFHFSFILNDKMKIKNSAILFCCCLKKKGVHYKDPKSDDDDEENDVITNKRTQKRKNKIKITFGCSTETLTMIFLCICICA